MAIPKWSLCSAKSQDLTSTAVVVGTASDIQPFDKASILAIMAGSSGTVTFTVQVSMDGTTWYSTTVYDLTAAAVQFPTQEASVAITADTTGKVIIGLPQWFPFIRLLVANASNSTIVLTADIVAR